MGKRSKKTQKTQGKMAGYVVVVFAEDIEQALEYKDLLDSNDIPSIIQEQNELASAPEEIAVMVPEEYLDEAHVIIESQQVYDDFCEFALDDDSDIDFDDDIYGDDY